MNQHILVIDDEEGIRFTFENFLTEEGYEVRTAGGYGDAISAISEKDFDVIFTDILLKDMTGLTYLERSEKRISSLPLL